MVGPPWPAQHMQNDVDEDPSDRAGTYSDVMQFVRAHRRSRAQHLGRDTSYLDYSSPRRVRMFSLRWMSS